MDKDLVKQFGIEEDIKKMRLINEYSFITKPVLGEDGDDQTQPEQTGQGGQPQQQPPMDGGQQMPPQAGGQQPAPGQGQMPPMGGGTPESGEPMPMDGPVGGVGTDVDAPADNGGAAPEGDPTDLGSDEVIDVDDLTNAQASTEYKVDDITSKVDRILNVVDLMKSALDQNDEKLKELQGEIERRNPTPEEKLNIRSQSSYPYSTTPKDYWEGVKNDPSKNYDVSFENDNPAEENKEDDRTYDILAQDVDNLDLKKVSDSLDNMPSLDDYLGLK